MGDGARFGMRITYSCEPVILGTGGGIKQVETWFGGEPVLVLNGDTLFELDLTSLISLPSTRTMRRRRWCCVRILKLLAGA